MPTKAEEWRLFQMKGEEFQGNFKGNLGWRAVKSRVMMRLKLLTTAITRGYYIKQSCISSLYTYINRRMQMHEHRINLDSEIIGMLVVWPRHDNAHSHICFDDEGSRKSKEGKSHKPHSNPILLRKLHFHRRLLYESFVSCHCQVCQVSCRCSLCPKSISLG